MKPIIAVASLIITSQSAYAAPSETFTEEKFAQLAATQTPFVVAFHSDSCGSCKVQKPNLEKALLEPALMNMKGLMADFDATEGFRKKLDKPVRGPSTILVFANGKEVARIQGETQKEKIVDTLVSVTSQR